jgi:hypothetical protein
MSFIITVIVISSAFLVGAGFGWWLANPRRRVIYGQDTKEITCARLDPEFPANPAPLPSPNSLYNDHEK